MVSFLGGHLVHCSHISGLVLSQAIFLAYMVVLRKLVNVGLAAFLIVFTVIVKIMYGPFEIRSLEKYAHLALDSQECAGLGLSWMTLPRLT
jgi:hypothetical protein